jgi:hypothetical protein
MVRKKAASSPPAEKDTRKDEEFPEVHMDAAGKAYTQKDLKDIPTPLSFDAIIVGKKSCICKVYVNKDYSADEYHGSSGGLPMVCDAIFLYYYIFLFIYLFYFILFIYLFITLYIIIYFYLFIYLFYFIYLFITLYKGDWMVSGL